MLCMGATEQLKNRLQQKLFTRLEGILAQAFPRGNARKTFFKKIFRAVNFLHKELFFVAAVVQKFALAAWTQQKFAQSTPEEEEQICRRCALEFRSEFENQVRQ